MRLKKAVPSLLQIGIAGVLLFAGNGRVLAHSAYVQEAQRAGSPTAAAMVNWAPQSSTDDEPDPNAESVTDILEADLSGTLDAGPALPDDPNQFDPIDNPDAGEESLAGGVEIGVNGETPVAGPHHVYIPVAMNGGSVDAAAAATVAAASVAAAPMQAAGPEARLETAAAHSGASASASPGVMGDFNDDGFADLAVGVPYEDIVAAAINHQDAGSVHVIYGSANGLSATGNQLWTQNSAGVADTVEAFDYFGFAVAAGDFNGDGFDDLAISAQGEDMGGIADVGAVHILFGSAAGLTAMGSQFWGQDSAGIPDSAETADRFGTSLTASKFSDDNFDDLAVGVPYEDLAGVIDGGLVHVLYGGAGGLTTNDTQIWHQSVRGVLEVTEKDDLFGYTLAAGDFDASDNSLRDLVIGVPYENVNNIVDAGAVQIIRSAELRLSVTGNQLFTQATANVVDSPEAGDRFGYALAAANFDGEFASELAIGVPGQTALGNTDAGAVHLLYSNDAGIDLTFNNMLTQGAQDIMDSGAEAGDNFGWSLAAGLFNTDSISDLAVGVPFEDVRSASINTTFTDAGAVSVLYGLSGQPLTTVGSQFWSQERPGVLEAAENNDNFGWSLSVGNFDSGNRHDLVIGVPSEKLGGVEHMGGLNAVYGPLGADKQQFWSQDTAGILGTGEADDYFGRFN